MPHVVHVERVAVGPSVKIGYARRIALTKPEAARARPRFREPAKSVHDAQQP